MDNVPFSVEICFPQFRFSRYDNYIQRTLKSMQGQFSDPEAYQAMLEQEDTLLYEDYELKRPEIAGELLSGLSIVHPGKVGQEYFMTKGHFHTELATAEIYYCLQGNGCIVMETKEGEWAVEALQPGKVLYVPPCWAHRSVNTCTEDLITFFVYPGNSGHDYGTIERQGFRKLVLEQDGAPDIVDNLRWLDPMKRA